MNGRSAFGDLLRQLAWGAGASALLLSTACGEDPADWEPGRPRIDRLQFVQADPQRALELVFSVEFFDSEGDLGAGSLELRLDGQVAALEPLDGIFGRQTPSLALDATEGEIEVSVELTGEVLAGTQVEVGFVLIDEKTQRSNEPSITLEASR